jgi:hypothetical protein
LRVIDGGFDKDTTSSDVDHRFVVAQFEAGTKSLGVKEIVQVAGIRQGRFN